MRYISFEQYLAFQIGCVLTFRDVLIGGIDHTLPVYLLSASWIASGKKSYS